MTDLATQAPSNVTKLNPKKVYRIGELARLTDSTTRTLRYYEELGLLEPIRNTSGQRLYSEDCLKRLDYIHQMKSGGFALNEIKNLFDSWQTNQTGAQAAGATIHLVQKKLDEINKAQKELATLSQELQTMISFLLNCQTCEHEPNVKDCGECSKNDMPTPAMLKNILKTKEGSNV
jgi:DNA-binding transcriptional MerR regulator